MNFSCRYLKKFYPTSGGLDLTSIDINYLVIADIQGQISIIFQIYSVESFMGTTSENFWSMSLRKRLNRLMGQNCSYLYSLFFLINKPMRVEYRVFQNSLAKPYLFLLS